MSLPLVTCICLTTRARAAWLPRVIECFRLQTYAQRELLVVSEDVPPVFGLPPDMRVAQSPRGVTLGAKHNWACALASGPLIAKWDDDDWSHPQRLSDQVERLQQSGKAVTGYTQMKFTDGLSWWRYASDANWPLGTSLLFRQAWWEHNRFPDEQIASDNQVVLAAQAQRQVAIAPAGGMMVATIHRDNLNDRSRDLGKPHIYPRLPASEAVPEALVGWPEAEAAAC